MSKVKLALIGAGERGKDRYGAYALTLKSEVEFIAVAEPNEARREAFAKAHDIAKENVFTSWQALLNCDKLCDGIIIATQDDMHFSPTKTALEKGYHVLLEKPMSNDPKEIMALGELDKQYNNTFMICHVLRYTPFFGKIKELIDSGIIGKVMSIQHNENIGHFHMAHSFVRGNWRNTALSSPIILAKSCHDMDILLWLVGQKSKKIASFGNLSYFNDKNAPQNAARRCYNCDEKKHCTYNAYQFYQKHLGKWPTTVVTEQQTEHALKEALETGPYGRCVFYCDNDVCDHQVTIITFEDGTTATFNLSAFTDQTHRTIKIMGSKGEIRGDDKKHTLEVSVFGKEQPQLVEIDVVGGGHGGGDYGIIDDFISLLKGKTGRALTSAQVSVESHMMAFAAENARLKSTVVDINTYSRRLL